MPSFYESARLRLKTSLAGALIFEYKTDQKNWLALPWLDGRVILDHWKRVLSFDGSLWAASPAGLVSFRTLPGGAAYLDPANFTLVQEPLVENVFCSVSDIKEINGAVWIRCNSNSSQVFSGRLTSGKDQANFSLNPTGDPFAAESLITKEESNLWRWDLKERANGSLGKIDVYLTGPNQKEELVGLFNGQWGFDAVESLTFHEQDWVEMAGQLAGWYRAPSSDLHLRNWLRQTDWPALLPASIAWVGSGKSKGEAIFCLRSNDGMYARVISDKLEQKISSCADFQADEGLWQYDLLEGNLEISGSERAIHDITRELRDGRFTDDIVVGLPIPVSEDAGVYYLLPTEAGILRFTQENARTDLIKLGKDKTEPEMTVLAQFPESGPVFYRSGQLFALEKPDEAPVLTLQLPDPEGVTAIEDGPLNYLRVWVTSAGGTSWFLVDPQTGLIAAEKVLPVMVEGFDVYRENVLRWGPSPYLQVQFYLGEISFLKTQAQPPINAKLGANFDLIIPISVGEQMVLVGKQNVLVSNLSRAMRELLK